MEERVVVLINKDDVQSHTMKVWGKSCFSELRKRGDGCVLTNRTTHVMSADFFTAMFPRPPTSVSDPRFLFSTVLRRVITLFCCLNLRFNKHLL